MEEVTMSNLKEFNHCLRYHTNAIIDNFNLKVVDINYPTKVCYTCVEGYAGVCPSCSQPKLMLDYFTEDVYDMVQFNCLKQHEEIKQRIYIY